jgi:hypothetical protein
MTSIQFMLVIGTIYVAHDMDEDFRKFAALCCFVIAALLQWFQ